jgi:hypothetical protein
MSVGEIGPTALCKAKYNCTQKRETGNEIARIVRKLI